MHIQTPKLDVKERVQKSTLSLQSTSMCKAKNRHFFLKVYFISLLHFPGYDYKRIIIIAFSSLYLLDM